MSSDQNSALKAGIFVLLCLALLITVIIVLGQSSQLFTKQYMLWAEFNNAKGLMAGADVRLAGVNVGSVREVFLATKRNGEKVVRVYLDIVLRYQPMVTTTSRASIQSLGPLGDKYVEISFSGAQEADQLPGKEQSAAFLGHESRILSDESADFYQLARQAQETLETASTIAKQITLALDKFHQTDVVEDLGANVKSLRRMVEQIEQGDGLLHALIYDKELPKIAATLKEISQSLNTSAMRVEKGPGSLHELIYGETLKTALTDAADVSAKAKRILKEVEDGDGTIHALIYEHKEREILAEIGKAAQLASRILADIHEGRGTLGLLIADPELWETMKRVLGGVEESRTLKYLVRQRADE